MSAKFNIKALVAAVGITAAEPVNDFETVTITIY